MKSIGRRQQDLLRHLQSHPQGQTVEELAQALAITRSAVRQHLAGLERDALVTLGGTRPTGGRPEQLYILSDQGREMAPRHYAWFARLLIESVQTELGSAGLGQRLATIGRQVASELLAQAAPSNDPEVRLARLAALMTELGYDAEPRPETDDRLGLAASNCVFHHLAARFPEVCQLDLALLATYLGRPVEHAECMVRGGQRCHFRFLPAGSPESLTAAPASGSGPETSPAGPPVD